MDENESISHTQGEKSASKIGKFALKWPLWTLAYVNAKNISLAMLMHHLHNLALM